MNMTILEWSDTVTQLVIDLLAHSTPTSCISSNILSVTKVILPNFKFIHQIPGVEFIFFCRVTFSYLANLLVSNELAISPKLLEQHTDGTSRRQKECQNNIFSIVKEGGFKHVTLDYFILSVNGNREMVKYSTLQSFQTGRQMLDMY